MAVAVLVWPVLSGPAAPPVRTSSLASGIASLEKRDFAIAIRHLKAAERESPKLADYALYNLAAAQRATGDLEAARQTLTRFARVAAESPLAAQAALLEASVLMSLDKPEGAVAALRKQEAALPHPSGEMALAQAEEAAGDPVAAVAHLQKVYYLYPATSDADTAKESLIRLRASLAERFPPAMPPQMLERADRLRTAREYSAARSEYEQLTKQLGGADRDLAAVRVGVVDYYRGQTEAAHHYLDLLKVDDPAADAERLYYLLACARRLDDDDGMKDALRTLQKKYPQSEWRRDALVWAGNRYLLVNDAKRYVPLFHECTEAFPADPEAAYCHWKVAWNAYLTRDKDAPGLLREHITRYPGSVKASAALYYLGRVSEQAGDHAAARAFYDKIQDRFPGHYYGMLARDRLASKTVQRATPSPDTRKFLASIAFPDLRHPETFKSTEPTRHRIERARWLEQAGLKDLAVAELRFGARTDAQPHLMAIELAKNSTPHQGMRWMKSLVRDYLSILPEEAPDQFWRYLFPLPFETDLVRNTQAQGLDPHIVAGLIRQESEFDPHALSRAKAYGLTQIRPSTGRQLARRAGIRRFRTSMLYQPGTNLKLGTIYLKSLLDQWDGNWEEALASYNAGKSRVLEWITWGDFREPAEFVETIPFTETREYVQSVLRNAEMYRKVYGLGTRAGNSKRKTGG